MTKTFSLIAASVALTLSTQAVGAVTVTYTVGATASEADIPGTDAQYGTASKATEILVNDLVTAGQRASIATASLDFNGSTGQIKYGASAVAEAAPDFGNRLSSVSAFTDFLIRETFTVTQGGILSFDLWLDGRLTLPERALEDVVALNNQIEASANYSFNMGVVFQNVVQSYGDLSSGRIDTIGTPVEVVNTPPFIQVDDLLNLTFDVKAGDRFELILDGDAGVSIETRLAGEVTAGANFLNTASLSLTGSEGAAWTTSDPAFLSASGPTDPVDPSVSPVPVPASLPLLLAAMGGIAALRRGRA